MTPAESSAMNKGRNDVGNLMGHSDFNHVFKVAVLTEIRIDPKREVETTIFVMCITSHSGSTPHLSKTYGRDR